MYIPTSYFSSQGACISTATSIISGSGIITSGSFYSSSQVYNWLKFEMSNLTSSALTSLTASLTISTGSTLQGRVLVVGAGASGTTTGSFVDGTVSYNVRAAAGGGGGGIVEYTNFPLTPGVYEIGVGAASPRSNATFITASKGNSSYFKNIFAYTPFTSSFIIAEGGGTGNIRATSTTSPYPVQIINGVNGGSGGGAANTYRIGTFPASQNALSGTLGQPNFGGITNGPQGYNGGNYNGGDSSAGGGNANYGIGGGGAAGRGVDGGYGSIDANDYATNGGAGLTKLMSGSSVVLSGGGGGAGQTTSLTNMQSGSRGSESYGAGGTGDLGAGTNTNILRRTIGNAGVVYIEWPLCTDEYSNCTQYIVLGGAVGGTITYIPCGSTTITSSVVEALTSSSICTKEVLSYPSTTGTITLQNIGNCNEFIPLPSPVSCPDSGTIKTALYDYTFNNLPGICYPRPDYCAQLFYQPYTVYYYDINNTLQSSSTYSQWSPSYISVCAKSSPAPYSTLNGNSVTSSLVCQYYCAITSSNQLSTNGLVLQIDTTSLTGSVWYDRSGKGNNGLISGSALALSSSLGYEFNGTNNYLTFPTNLTATPSSSYCLQWWGSSYITGSNYFLFSKGDYTIGWDTIYRPNDKSLVFRDNGGGDEIYVTNYAGGNKALFTMNLSVSSKNINSFYFNTSGSLRQVVANAFNSASTTPLRFGYNVNGDATLFKGTVAGLTLYNRNLTPEEIENNYNYYLNNF